MKTTETGAKGKIPGWVFAKARKAGGTKKSVVAQAVATVRKPQNFAGNPPNEADGWQLFGRCYSQDKVVWNVFCRHQSEKSEWIGVKVVAVGVAARKANYWFSYNFKEKRAAKTKDFGLMESGRSDLCEAVFDVIEDYLEDENG